MTLREMRLLNNDFGDTVGALLAHGLQFASDRDAAARLPQGVLRDFPPCAQ